MSDSSDEQVRAGQDDGSPTETDSEDVEALREQVEEKYDFCRESIYAV
ncbi:hypothetical protein [Haloarcula laminariae]|nr:hypothetical protein [Halomicroarcula sp. FL173]